MSAHGEHNRAKPVRTSASRKAYRACVACVNSKIRCEDVTYPEGCLRCRTKKRVCSLATARAAGDNDRSLPNSDGLMLCRLRALEDELADVRKGLLQVQSQRGDDSATPVGSVRSGSALVETPNEIRRPISTSQLASALNWRKVEMSEGLFTMSSQDSYPDPVTNHLLTLDELDGAFDLLKVRLATLYPATPFLRSSTPLPRHPFVRLAIAAHMLRSTRLYQYIETSVVVAATGSVSSDVLLALLLLSLAPFPTDCSKAPITSLRYIALAYSLGQTMGMDTAANVNLGSPWLMHEPWAEPLSHLLLWEAIRNRYTMVGCMQSRLSSIDTFGATQLPHHLPSVYNAAIRSLIAERELFAIVAPLLGEIGVAEAGPIGMLPDISALTASWVSVTNTLQSWRTQRESPRGLVLLDSFALSFSLTLRLSCLASNIPSPINPDLRSSHRICTGVSVMQHAIIFCEHINNIPEYELSTLPAYVLSQYAVAVAIQQRSLDYFQAICVTSEHLSQPVFEMAAGKIMDVIGGLPAVMLRDLRSRLTTIPFLPADGSVSHEHVDLFEGVPPDFWQFLQTFCPPDSMSDMPAASGFAPGVGA